MHDNARDRLKAGRDRYWEELKENLHMYKDGLKREEAKQKVLQSGQEKDKSNKETLELMSVMAQKIDEDNQQLMRKNQDLNIQYLSQENDREILIKQIIYHKKRNQKLQQQHEETKEKVMEVRRDQQQQQENSKMLAPTPQMHQPRIMKVAQ